MFEIFRQMAFIFEFIFAFYFVNINKLFVGDFLEVVLFLSQFHSNKTLIHFRVQLYLKLGCRRVHVVILLKIVHHLSCRHEG